MKPAVFLLLLLNCTGQLFCQDKTFSLDSLFNTCYKPGEPGAAIAILDKGKIIFKKGFGLAGMQTKEAIDSGTNFNIGSLTKQFTAFGILRLASQKRLLLTDKLIKYFPDFNPKTGNAISIRQLLTHSSGIMDHYAFTDTHAVKHATDKDVLAAVKNLDSTYFTPGSQYRYSNTAYCLLALIIEKLSGLSYADYIKKNIFHPLGMTHSEVLRMGSPIYHRALGYDTGGAQSFHKLDAGESIFFSTEGDGGIYTSVEDYLKWLAALQQGVLPGKAWTQQAQSPQFAIDPVQKLSYGYGWFISEAGKTKAVYHTGSNGGFRAVVFSIPSRSYAVIIFSNRTDIDLEKTVSDINRILGIDNKFFIKISSLTSFNDTCPIFAPCKEIPSFSTLFTKSLNANDME